MQVRAFRFSAPAFVPEQPVHYRLRVAAADTKSGFYRRYRSPVRRRVMGTAVGECVDDQFNCLRASRSCPLSDYQLAVKSPARAEGSRCHGAARFIRGDVR